MATMAIKNAVTYAEIIFNCLTMVQEYYSTRRRWVTVVPVNVIGRILRFRAMIKRYRCFAIALADCIINFINMTSPLFRYLIYIYYWYIFVTWCNSIGELLGRL
jgi:hypothetical protein